MPRRTDNMENTMDQTNPLQSSPATKSKVPLWVLLGSMPPGLKARLKDSAWLVPIAVLAAAVMYIVPLFAQGPMRDLLTLVLGVVIGGLVSIAIYWYPLCQLHNELCALWNLMRHRYPKGCQVTIKAQSRLESVVDSKDKKDIFANTPMFVWHDEGVTWFHAGVWIRARVLHVGPSSGDEGERRVCHRSILS